MKIYKNKYRLINEINKFKSLSFIPTMGALHEGHISLIKKARKKFNKIIVSIYVNPKQFENKIDFKNYPVNFQNDIKLLKKNKVDYLFIPNFKQIFSFKPRHNIYVDKFEKKLCGKHRAGHFKGVIEVVNRLLEIINPRFLYLGVKDFQQMILIKNHIKKTKIKTKIISCKTIRDKNGLALSSRNQLLNTKERKIAGNIVNFLKRNKKRINSRNINKFKMVILNKGISKIDYVKILNVKSLNYANRVNKNCRVFIAYYIREIRLIDNF